MLCVRVVLLASLLTLVSQTSGSPAPHPRSRRQLPADSDTAPLSLETEPGEEQLREKRKLEGVTQAKFGVKNAILGFVFGKINSLIDAKTRLVETLDRQNIEKNKAYGIEAPANGLASLSGLVGQVIGPKLQLLGPKLQAVTGLLGGASGGGAGGSAGASVGISGSSSGGSGLGSLLSLVTSLSGGSSGGAAGGTASVDTLDSSEEEDDA